MSDSLKRQDASSAAGMPLSVCHNGRVLAAVPPHLRGAFGEDARPAPALWEYITEIAATHRLAPDDTELLMPCHLHPYYSAVDCLECEPVDSAPNSFPTVDYPAHELAEDLGVIDRANARAREAEEGRTDTGSKPLEGS